MFCVHFVVVVAVVASGTHQFSAAAKSFIEYAIVCHTLRARTFTCIFGPLMTRGWDIYTKHMPSPPSSDVCELRGKSTHGEVCTTRTQPQTHTASNMRASNLSDRCGVISAVGVRDTLTETV